jgi:hypothetical protein
MIATCASSGSRAPIAVTGGPWIASPFGFASVTSVSSRPTTLSTAKSPRSSPTTESVTT